MKEQLRRPTLAPSPLRALGEGVNQRVRGWTATEVVRPLVEPILHPSTWRIRALGGDAARAGWRDSSFMQW